MDVPRNVDDIGFYVTDFPNDAQTIDQAFAKMIGFEPFRFGGVLGPDGVHFRERILDAEVAERSFPSKEPSDLFIVGLHFLRSSRIEPTLCKTGEKEKHGKGPRKRSSHK